MCWSLGVEVFLQQFSFSKTSSSCLENLFLGFLVFHRIPSQENSYKSQFEDKLWDRSVKNNEKRRRKQNFIASEVFLLFLPETAVFFFSIKGIAFFLRNKWPCSSQFPDSRSHHEFLLFSFFFEECPFITLSTQMDQNRILSWNRIQLKNLMLKILVPFLTWNHHASQALAYLFVIFRV